MALNPIITRTSVTETGDKSTITDQTVYGAPEADRVDVAVFLTAFRVPEDLIESPLLVETFNPKTVTEFIVPNGVDGRHRYKFIIAPDWNVAVKYTKYDVVWSPTETKFYEYINDTDTTANVVTSTTYWQELADPTTKIAHVGTIQESGNLLYVIYERILDYQTAKCYGSVAILAAKEDCANGCDPTKSKYKIPRDRLRTLLSVMQISDARQQYLQGERFAREAAYYCDECGCLEQ